jgi:hypothetical protein
VTLIRYIDVFLLGAIFGLAIGLYLLHEQGKRNDRLAEAYHRALNQFMQDELDRNARFQEFVVTDKEKQ